MNSAAFSTAREVEALRPGAKLYERSDALCPGLRIRVYPSGAKAYIARLRAADRRTRVLTLGKVADLTLAAARAQVRALQQDRAATGDPIAARKRQQGEELARLREAEARDGFTVRKMTEAFLGAHPLSTTTHDDYAGAFRRDVIPTMGARPAASITSAEVRALRDRIAKRGKVTADRTLAALSSAFSWALEEGRLEANPVRGVKRAAGTTRRSRNLSVEELTVFMRGLSSEPIPEDSRRYLEVLLRTAQRPGEVAGMSWEEVQGDVWVIPSSRYKTRRDHRVPLVPQVRALIGEGERGPVFPRRRRDGARAPLRLDSALFDLKRALQSMSIAHAGLHDLRRTAESRMVDTLRLDPFTVHHAVTGHARPGLMEVYQVAGNLDLAREALGAWNKWLDTIYSG